MIIFLILGAVAALFQLVITREFVFSIAKNEFSLIAAIGVWLLFCSLGSLWGKRKTLISGQYVPFVFALLFCLCLALIHSAKHIIGSNYYELTSFAASACLSIFLIGPVGFLVGYCFAQFSRCFLEKDKDIYAYFFAYEALGFFIAGVLFAFFLSSYANPFVFALLPLLFVPFLGLSKKKVLLSATAILIVAAVFSALYPWLLKKEFQNAAIISNRGSPYGPLVETERFGTRSLFVSGNLAATSEDAAGQEAFIHTSIASCEKLDNVLVIGAASFGQIAELTKYNIGSIDCLELNPLLVSWCRSKLSQQEKERVHFIIDDPRAYLRTTQKRYDCILMNVNAPESIALNRYFSLEFFSLAEKRLAQKGVFSFSIPSQRDILSPRYIQFDSCIMNTLERVFSRRFIVPADSMLVLASNSAAFSEETLLSRFDSRKPSTQYFTHYHLTDLLDTGHRDYINSLLDSSIAVNTDYRPLGFFYYALLQEAKFDPRSGLTLKTSQRYTELILSAFMVLWIFLIARRPGWRISFQAAAFGFASISLTGVIIMLFQVLSGALFWKLGIVIGSCMLGIAIAVFLVNSLIKSGGFRPYLVSLLYVIWLFVFSGLLISLRLNSWLLRFDLTLYAYSLLGGLCTGAMYPLLSQLLLLSRSQVQAIAGQVYSADLLGAFFGTLFCSFVLLPVWGIEAALNILIAIMFLCCLQSLRN